MRCELKRALFKRSNLVLVIAIVSLMLINAYNNGWKTALTVGSAQDMQNIEDVIFYKKYFGNVYRVWQSAYYVIQALAPLILAAPYLNSYLSEKANHFRYYCVSRKGNWKYVLQKVLAIAISGMAVLAFSELVFAIITGIFTQHDTSVEFLQDIVHYKEEYFFENPMLYFVLIFASHIAYYFCFLIFAIGVSSLFKNKIAVIVSPFIVASAFELAFPPALQPNVVMQPYSKAFTIGGYGALVAIYLVLGISLLIVSEGIYQRRGN